MIGIVTFYELIKGILASRIAHLYPGRAVHCALFCLSTLSSSSGTRSLVRCSSSLCPSFLCKILGTLFVPFLCHTGILHLPLGLKGHISSRGRPEDRQYVLSQRRHSTRASLWKAKGSRQSNKNQKKDEHFLVHLRYRPFKTDREVVVQCTGICGTAGWRA